MTYCIKPSDRFSILFFQNAFACVCSCFTNSYSGVAHKIPCDALITATDSYDPRVFGPEDDVLEDDDGEGNKVTLLRDWTHPPVAQRCKCQLENRPCGCGKGVKPQGQSLKLTWDKVNTPNRCAKLVFNFQ